MRLASSCTISGLPEAPSASQATGHNIPRTHTSAALDTMQLSQPSTSQPLPSQPSTFPVHTPELEPVSGDFSQRHAADALPSHQSCEGSKQLSSWPGDDSIFTEADDLIDLTVEDSLSQQHQRLQSDPGRSPVNTQDVAKLPMAARWIQMLYADICSNCMQARLWTGIRINKKSYPG